MSKKAYSFAVLFFILSITICIAQDDQYESKKEFKNTISYNISNPALFGFKTFIFSYERVVSHNQSFCIDFGTITFPQISIIPSSIKANSESSEHGYKIGGDYRYYPAGENKHNAPRGVYIAPYFIYNYFDRKKSFEIDTATTGVPIEVKVSTDFNLQITTAGFELGYQFIFWRRFALDLVLFGPGISKYSVSATLDTDLEPDKESELFKAINDALADKIPGYNVVIDSAEFNKKGTTNTTSIGYRYLVKVGFRF